MKSNIRRVIFAVTTLSFHISPCLELALADGPPLQWQKTFGGNSRDNARSVQQTSDGGYIIAGVTYSFGKTEGDVYLIKTDLNGNSEWQKTFGVCYDTDHQEYENCENCEDCTYRCDKGYSVKQTSDGGYIIAGTSEHPGDVWFNVVYLIKTDSVGNLLWHKLPDDLSGCGESCHLNGTGRSVQQTSDGGYIITGETPVEFNIDMGTYWIHISHIDIYLLKIDPSGNSQWLNIFHKYGDDDIYGYSVQQTTDGGYIITGTIYPYGTEDADVFLIRTDSDGDVQWETTFGGNDYDYGYSVQQTSDGGYIIAGATNSYGAGFQDAYLIKTDPNGNFLWQRAFGGSEWDDGYSVQQTSDGGYIIVGASCSFGDEYDDVYLIKTNSAGNLLWQTTFGGSVWDVGNSVQQTSDGGYIIAGETYSMGDPNGDVYLIKIGENQFPVASFAYSPENPTVDEEITFDASSSNDIGGTIESCDWDFGDGQYGQGQVTSHSYSSDGEYLVSLIVTDNDGLTNSISQTIQITVPVILVHGWRPALDSGYVATWEVLKPRLESAGIPCYEFNYLPATGDPRLYAEYLDIFVEMLRQRIGYTWKFDIVCHSMGALVSRYYMEELGGATNVRQWIGIAPVNHGADLANAQPFFFPWLHHFFPSLRGTEKAITEMQTNSPTVRALEDNVLSPDVRYRVIAGVNTSRNVSFGGVATGGKTLREQRHEEMEWVLTHLGDGFVALRRSLLSGAGIDCFDGLDHNELPQDTDVCARVVEYLTTPSLDSSGNIPDEDPGDTELVAFGTRAEDTVGTGETHESGFVVDSTVQKAMVICNWPGSDLDMTLISPSGNVLDPYTVAEYYKSDTSIWYTIDSPEAGEWTAIVEAIDVPTEGESFGLATFYASLLTLTGATCEDKTLYYTGEIAMLLAHIENNDVPVSGASVTAEITHPDLSSDSLVLYDDGMHGDVNAGDGCYSSQYLLANMGAYPIAFSAYGMVASTPFERTNPMTLWVTYLGDIDGDEDVDFSDFTLFVDHWLETDCLDPNWCNRTDFDKSGTVDFADFAFLAQNWLLGENVADIDINGKVNLADYTIFASHWMEQNCIEPNWCAGTDINKDSHVDILDLAELAQHWLDGT